MDANHQPQSDDIRRFDRVKQRLIEEGSFTPTPPLKDQQSLHAHPDFLDNGISAHPGMTSQGSEVRDQQSRAVVDPPQLTQPQGQSAKQSTDQTPGEKLSARIRASQEPAVARNITEGKIHPPEKTKELSKSLSRELARHQEKRAQEEFTQAPRRESSVTL